MASCPGDYTTSACLSQEEANEAFDAWLAGFQVLQACPGVVGGFTATPRAPGKCGGATTVTFTATNPNGCGASSCTRSFTVPADTQPPMGACPSGLTALECAEDIPPPSESMIAASYTDNCGQVSVTLANVIGTENNCSFAITYIYRIYDDCGNATTCRVVHSGGDDNPPTGTCPPPVTGLQYWADVPSCPAVPICCPYAQARKPWPRG